MMKVYVASKSVHGPRWITMREHGAPFVSSWIDESGPGQTSDWADLTARCVREAAAADGLIVYAEPGEILKGALIEWGAALAAGKPVVYVGPKHKWTVHPLVQTADSVEQALNKLWAQYSERMSLGKKSMIPCWVWPFVWIGDWLKRTREE